MMGDRVEFYPYWQWELETWDEGSYVSCPLSDVVNFHRREPSWLFGPPPTPAPGQRIKLLLGPSVTWPRPVFPPARTQRFVYRTGLYVVHFPHLLLMWIPNRFPGRLGRAVSRLHALLARVRRAILP